MNVLLLINVLNKLNTQENITDVTLFTSLLDLFVVGDDLKVQLSLGIPYYTIKLELLAQLSFD